MQNPSVYVPIIITLASIVLVLTCLLILAVIQYSRLLKHSNAVTSSLSRISVQTGFYGVIHEKTDTFVSWIECHGFINPATAQDDKPEFTLIDPDLDLLVNLAVDMSKGRCNMDTGIWFMQTLDKVLDRLQPNNAPFADGQPVEKE